MKKLISLIVAVILVAGIMSIVMSADGYLADKEIPYGTAKIDGKFDEWSKAAKFTVDGSNVKIVGNASWTEGNAITVSLMHDDTYLYFAYEVTNTDKGLLYFGAGGEGIAMFFDIAGVAAANGDKNMHNGSVKVVPVVASAGSTDVTGALLGYPTSKYNANDWVNISNTENVLEDVAAIGSGETYSIEARVKLADMRSMIADDYGVEVPEVKAGTEITFMISYDNYGKNQLQANWSLTAKDGPYAVPSQYGFRGVLAEKSASTADMTAIVVLVSAVAAGAVALMCKKH